MGEVLNSTDTNNGSKPGAAIYLPPGDNRLRTQVVIDISFLHIYGSVHGFTSSSIRFNGPEEEWPDLHELRPGGSRIQVDLPVDPEAEESAAAAFLITREGSPRISSVEFSNFCIDGLHFVADGTSALPENTYVNGKTGIYVGSANDSFRINEMGFIYLEHALTICNADALSIHDNFIAECGSCIELRGWGQASKITDNLIGAGFKGHSTCTENRGGLLIYEVVDSQALQPAGPTPVIIRLTSGNENYVATNPVVVSEVRSTSPDSCFEAQVDELLANELPVVTVQVDAGAQRNTILYSDTETELKMDSTNNAGRTTPCFTDAPA